MRTVLVVCEGRIPWKDVKRLIAKANARVLDCTLAQLAETAGRTSPDLVMLDDAAHQAARGTLRQPQVVVRSGGTTGVTMPTHARPAVAWVSWPLDERTFLELIARMLRVSERRIFRTLIRIFLPRSGEWLMGRSEDFSLTGLAFHIDRAFTPGETLTVYLHLPEDGGAVQFDVEIAREAVNPADGGVYHGARFVRLEPQVRQKLQDFILKER